MARQLVYTSAPAGLTPGRSGFCTVARHRDLRDRLVSRIEGFSAYPAEWRPAPIIHAFRWVDVAGTRYAVLSRLVDAGHDYTHRNNFLAHHLILDADEAASAPRPADILFQWRGWLNRWDTTPRWFDAADSVDLSQLPPPPAPALPAQTWRDLTGEGGRAALLVESPHAATRRLLRHSPEQETAVLRLFRESSALLVPGGAWGTEFITCLQPHDVAAEFAWAGIRANTACDTSRESGIILDLTDPRSLPAAPDNALGRAAMGGSTAPGMFGNLSAYAPSVHEPVAQRYTRNLPKDDPSTPAGAHAIFWIAGSIMVVLCVALLAWLLLFHQSESASAMARTSAPNATVTTPPPPPAQVPGEDTAKTLALQRAWSEIEQLTTSGKYFEALDRWRDMEKTTPEFTALHIDFLKSRLLPAAQKDWSNNLAQIVAKLNEGQADRAALQAQLEAMQSFPYSWPVPNAAALDAAWKSTAGIFKLLNALPNAPVWVVDDLTVSGAGDGYQDLTATVAIPELQALLTSAQFNAKISCAPANSLALPLRGEWFDFDVQPDDHARGDYLILHDSTRGRAGGRFFQFISEGGGKIRLAWRAFDEKSEFFRVPANTPLQNPSGRMWLRVIGEPPQPSFYLLLRRTDLATAAPWKALPAQMSWLAIEGAPASIKLPPWLAANLRLSTRPEQVMRLGPQKGGDAVADSYNNPQAQAATTMATVHYQAAWLMNVLDQQIRTLQTALIQTRDEVSKLKNSPDSPTAIQAHQTVDKMAQDLANLLSLRTSAASAGWPRNAAPWTLTQLHKPAAPLTLIEFYPDETGPTP